MKEEHDDLSRPGSQPLPGFEGRSLDNSKRREPLFAGFEEDDAYEEPDRDTNYATGFRQEAVEEEEPLDEHEAFEELLPEDLEADDAALFEEQEAFLKSEAGVDLKRHGGSVSWDDMHRDEEPQEADTDAWYDEDDTDYADDDLDEELEEDSAVTTMKPGEWLDEDPFTAEEDRSGRAAQEQGRGPPWVRRQASGGQVGRRRRQRRRRRRGRARRARWARRRRTPAQHRR